MNGEGSSESENGKTTIAYGDGGVPLYVGIVWVLFILSYLGVMSAVALPDLISWISS